jgi:DNA-binding response OmpR family regulator
MVTKAIPASSQPTSARILLVHQSNVVTKSMTTALEKAGMTVAVAHEGSRAIALVASFSPNVALIGLELNDMNGADLINWFADRDLGLIGLSDADEETSRVVALEVGADDCISTSLPCRELVARTRAVHRRMLWAINRRETPPASTTIDLGCISINLASRIVATQDQKPIALTGAEFNILEVMVGMRGQTMSRDALSQAALRRPWRAEDRSVDQLIFGLRQKLPLAADGSSIIHSVRGAGYVLRTPETTPNRAPLPMYILTQAVINEIGKAALTRGAAYGPLN